MADNSARIAELRKILETGMTSVTVDGHSVAIDLNSVRAELRRLMAEDDEQSSTRPIASNIYLGGF